jgi:hypothetical protein
LNKPPFAVWQQPVQVAVVIDDFRQRPRWQLTAQLALRLAPRVPESSKAVRPSPFFGATTVMEKRPPSCGLAASVPLGHIGLRQQQTERR